MTPEQLAELRRDYTAEPVPPCRVCGAALVIGKVGGGEPTEWYCPNATGPEKDAEDHFWASHFKQRWRGDERVIALLDEVERLRRENDALIILADGCPEHSSYRAKRQITTWCVRCNAMMEARKILADKDGGGE